MSKKKSYMNKNNIIKEGFLENLLQAILPSGVKKTITQAYIKQKKSDIKKAEQEYKKSIEKSKEIYNDYRKHIKKTTGRDLPKFGDKEAHKKFLRGIK